jgi:hypothetical protein
MSSTAPPPKSSGSKPFVIAVLLMLLLMGGLIYLKLAGDEQKPTAPPVATGTSAAPVIDQVIPPPPPPPTAASSSPTVVTKKTPKFDSGCSTCGNCQGTEGAGFRGTLSGRAALAQRCYEKALGTQEGLTGKLTVGLCVGVGGQVCSAGIEKDTLGSPLVSQCVLNIYRATTFPSPKNGCVQAQVPLNFIPKKL